MTYQHPTLGIRMQTPARPPDPPKPEGVTHRSSESPLEWLTRHGFQVTFYPGLVLARRFGPSGRVVDDWDGDTTRELALRMGWYP